MTYLIDVLPGLEFLQFLLVHLQLVLHHLGLLGSGEVDVAPAVHRPDVRFFQAPRVVPEDNLVDEGKLLVVFPGVKVVQLLDHFFQILDAFFQTAEFFDAEFLDDPLFERVPLDL